MTPAWTGASQWRMLCMGVESSTPFLSTWRAWRADPQRPRMLHVVAFCQKTFTNSAFDPDLQPLAELLDAQLWGLLPGFHRLAFEGGQLLLTLCIGDTHTLLRQQQFEADSVFLDQSAGHDLNPPPRTANDTLHTVKAIARLCRRGAALTTSQPDPHLQAALLQCGFAASPLSVLQYVFNPAWQPEKSPAPVQPGTCMVIGAGLAGAAVASSLARRGWAVTVLDAAAAPASGASALPAGLLVPHTSPDDSPLSRLSRSGVRITLQQARAVLRHGTDWGHTGVLQRIFDDELCPTPAAWAHDEAPAASDWCTPASARTLAAAGLPGGSTALWHAQAGWIKPAALVNAWLAGAGVTWQGSARVARLEHTSTGWHALNASGALLAKADMVILCAGYASRALAEAAGALAPDLQAIRGQVSCGLQTSAAAFSTPPPFPVNGYGGLIPGFTTRDGPGWLMGASYERDVLDPSVKPQDHTDNLTRLQTLLPHAAAALADQFAPGKAQGWAGIRCATPGRLPLVTPMITPAGANDAWLCTGMGSRGLSFAALCGELLAACLHKEPLPVEKKLATALRRPARKLV